MVNLLTRRPQEWKDTVTCDLTMMDNTVSKTFTGSINVKSSDPVDVIPYADAIILCMPVHQYRAALERVAPYINKTKKEVFVGTIYGQAGFNWMVHEMERDFNLTNIICFAVGCIPWICRTLAYGSHVANYGGKLVNVVAVSPREKFDTLNDKLLNDISFTSIGIGKFVQACSFISLTLSVDNQIIHPSRCYGLWKQTAGKWPDLESVPYFYRDFDDISTQVLTDVDNDYSAIRAAIRERFPDRPFKYMLNYFDLEKLCHGSKHVDIKASFRDSKQLGLIKTPTIEDDDGSQKLDTNCRFFKDDIPYGLLIAKWIGEQLNVKTPAIDEVIQWSQRLRGEKWITEDNKINYPYAMSHKQSSGIPPAYGITSVDKILD
jgi:opine dehydrogenase